MLISLNNIKSNSKLRPFLYLPKSKLYFFFHEISEFISQPTMGWTWKSKHVVLKGEELHKFTYILRSTSQIFRKRMVCFFKLVLTRKYLINICPFIPNVKWWFRPFLLHFRLSLHIYFTSSCYSSGNSILQRIPGSFQYSVRSGALMTLQTRPHGIFLLPP